MLLDRNTAERGRKVTAGDCPLSVNRESHWRLYVRKDIRHAAMTNYFEMV
ncbi:hypothetical protein HSR121_1318 [Halapricum desulfuricans]|uniref:Uncharacterized protein n=1 Tax=Halapricum desulfuricans TaxID=2841257 RepID=A0A897N2Y3_9EURY|nr:hypothetical protein HSR121_1318 [Halapricum desulfuricans]